VNNAAAYHLHFIRIKCHGYHVCPSIHDETSEALHMNSSGQILYRISVK